MLGTQQSLVLRPPVPLAATPATMLQHQAFLAYLSLWPAVLGVEDAKKGNTPLLGPPHCLASYTPSRQPEYSGLHLLLGSTAAVQSQNSDREGIVSHLPKKPVKKQRPREGSGLPPRNPASNSQIGMHLGVGS